MNNFFKVCPICTYEIDNNNLLLLKCGHIFHIKCIKIYLLMNVIIFFFYNFNIFIDILFAKIKKKKFFFFFFIINY